MAAVKESHAASAFCWRDIPVAPARTPAALVNRLNREIVRVLNGGDVKETFFNSGAETVGGSPEEFAATMKADIARMRKAIEEGGIRAE